MRGRLSSGSDFEDSSKANLLRGVDDNFMQATSPVINGSNHGSNA
jgi:hypothetical protein